MATLLLPAPRALTSAAATAFLHRLARREWRACAMARGGGAQASSSGRCLEARAPPAAGPLLGQFRRLRLAPHSPCSSRREGGLGQGLALALRSGRHVAIQQEYGAYHRGVNLDSNLNLDGCTRNAATLRPNTPTRGRVPGLQDTQARLTSRPHYRSTSTSSQLSAQATLRTVDVPHGSRAAMSEAPWRLHGPAVSLSRGCQITLDDNSLAAAALQRGLGVAPKHQPPATQVCHHMLRMSWIW